MVEFWDAGVTDIGREEEAAGDIQDTFHKRYARHTLELDSGGLVKAVRLHYNIHGTFVYICMVLYYVNVLVKSCLGSFIPISPLRTVKL